VTKLNFSEWQQLKQNHKHGHTDMGQSSSWNTHTPHLIGSQATVL